MLQELQNQLKGTYFICIDGINKPGHTDDITATLSAIVRYIQSQDLSDGVCLRLFISGSYENLSVISRDIGSGQAFTLDLCQGSDTVRTRQSGLRHIGLRSPLRLNTDDIEKVTSARVVEVCNIKPDLKDILNQSNVQLLLDSIRGNYRRLEAKLAAIIACDTERKVLDIIANSSDDVSTFQQNNLKALDSSLDSTQIRVLNEILVWVSGALENPSAKFLRSALYLAMGEKFFPESEIAITYSSLLKIDESGRVTFKSDDTKDILRASSAPGPDPDPASGSPSTEQISRAEVDLCRRFIKNACDSVDYTRFKFDEFFDALAHKSHIRLDDNDTVNVKIIRSCVNALCADGQDEGLRELREYASKYFYLHIKNLVEKLDNFDPGRQFFTDTGAKVLDLFYEPERIDTWIDEMTLPQRSVNWLYSNVYVDALFKFLKNPHVAKAYTGDARKGEWMKSIIVGPTNKALLLERVAARLANRWLNCTTHVSPRYFSLSYGLVTKVHYPTRATGFR